MPRKTTHPNATGIVMSNDTRFMLDRLKLALTKVAGYDHDISNSWLIAQCVHFAYCYTPCFLKLHMVQDTVPNDDASNQEQQPTHEAIPPSAEEAGKASDSGTAANRVHEVRSNKAAGDGPQRTNRP